MTRTYTDPTCPTRVCADIPCRSGAPVREHTAPEAARSVLGAATSDADACRRMRAAGFAMLDADSRAVTWG